MQSISLHCMNFISSADAFFKAAVSLVADVPKTIIIDGKICSTEAFLLEFLSSFFSTLLVVPVSVCNLFLLFQAKLYFHELLLFVKPIAIPIVINIQHVIPP